MPAEYLDLSYVAWAAMQESVIAGWGLYVDASGPPPSGAIPASLTARGQSLASLIETLGTQGRANGVRTSNTNEGITLITVGMPAWERYDGVLVHPLNVREQSASSSAQSDFSVTVDGDGVTSTVADAGARFPGRSYASSSDAGSTKNQADRRLETSQRNPGTITLEANVSLSDVRIGDIVPYIRAAGQFAGAMFLRVLSITVDESRLPATFTLVGQVVETNQLQPERLTKGAYWPGVRNTGSRFVRRSQGQ